MSPECVVAVYDTLDDAHAAVQALGRTPFPASQVSVITSTIEEEADVRKALELGDESTRDALLGAGAGGIFGLLAEATVAVVAGLGTVILAGAIVPAAMIVGAFIGAMRGWGVHSDHIAEYEQLVKDGKVLVIAHGEPRQVATAEQALMDTHPDGIRLHAQTSTDDPGIE
jgi:hypothetical protein